MDIYSDTQKFYDGIRRMIQDEINSNEAVKAAIKSKKAIVTTAAANNVVGVKLIGDNAELFLPYNTHAFALSDLKVGTVVSVWYNYSLANGIVMQNGTWSK
mgnify:CR=1 FL=1